MAGREPLGCSPAARGIGTGDQACLCSRANAEEGARFAVGAGRCVFRCTPLTCASGGFAGS